MPLLNHSKLIITILSILVMIFFISTMYLVIPKGATKEKETATSNSTARIPVKMKPASSKVNYRLPNSLKPISYELLVNPDLKNGFFAGEITAKFTVISNTNKIILHSSALNISNVRVFPDNELRKNLTVTNIELDTTNREFLTISVADILQQSQNYFVYIDFKGDLKKGIVGFYQSNYVNPDGKNRALATTKFEPTYARMAFPCFDEPGMKAKFEIKLIKPKNDEYIAISNMNVLKEEPFSDNETIVHFHESVPMSTYLVAYIVSDFKYTEKIIHPSPNLGKDFTFRVYATPHKTPYTELALETGSKVIQYYIDFFQIEYPLPKLDFAAVPDFPSGALETWGLIVFRETSLLFNPQVGSIFNKERIVETVSHELAHMWFGNLVTMSWWNELWLNEGFATYISYLGSDFAFPEWKMVDHFTISTLHAAFNIDAKLSSHAIVQNVTNPDQITAIFDTISYNKGASIINMLANFIGFEKFKKGITLYLNNHKYGNAESKNLFDALQSVAEEGIDVNKIMDTWTRQMGFPVVNVEEKTNGEYVLTQKRFLINPDANKMEAEPSEFNYKWTIPITYISSLQNKSHLVWFDQHLDNIQISMDPNIDFIKFNVDQNGYYRVNYDEKNWNKLTNAFSKLSVLDKTSLLNDAFSLAAAGQLKYAIPLQLSENLKKERELPPWVVASSSLNYLKKYLINTEYYTNLVKFAGTLLHDVLAEVKWEVPENDSFARRKLRVYILLLGCGFNEKLCLTQAGIEIKKWLNDPSHKVHQDIKSVVYKYGMMSIAGLEEWDIMWNRYLSETDAQEKNSLMSGLCSVPQTWLLARLINRAWDKNYVRRQDYFDVLRNIAANPSGTAIVWDYVRENWTMIVDEFGLNDRILGRLIPDITSSFSSRLKLNEMKAFFEMYPEAGAGERNRKEAIENVENNIKWLERNADAVGKWLQQNA